jgi:N6-adenosine-specific RNA methylase IME4
MKSHPFADAFPLLPEDELGKLADDIKAHGLRHPVVTYQGKILDGRNRFAACKLAGVDPSFDAFDGDDADARSAVWSCNAARRHLSQTQKACAWAELFPAEDLRGGARESAGRPSEIKPPRGGLNTPKGKLPPTNRAEPLELRVCSPTGVGKRTVDRARVAQTRAPELFEAMKSGLVDAKPAESIAKLEPEKQAQVLAAIRAGTKPAKALRQASKAVVRETNAKQELTGRYSLIYADPPWQYGNTGLAGAAEDHYPTMSTPEICALPIADHATDNAVLLLWVTNPLLPDALEVVKAWGFEYRTMYVWVKNRGTPAGFHVRSRTEMLWVCTRGKGMTIEPENLPDNVIDAPVTRHSAKPTEVYKLIEGLYPECKKLELFCRSPRDGWEVWGNEV